MKSVYRFLLLLLLLSSTAVRLQAAHHRLGIEINGGLSYIRWSPLTYNAQWQFKRIYQPAYGGGIFYEHTLPLNFFAGGGLYIEQLNDGFRQVINDSTAVAYNAIYYQYTHFLNFSIPLYIGYQYHNLYIAAGLRTSAVLNSWTHVILDEVYSGGAKNLKDTIVKKLNTRTVVLGPIVRAGMRFNSRWSGELEFYSGINFLLNQLPGYSEKWQELTLGFRYLLVKADE